MSNSGRWTSAWSPGIFVCLRGRRMFLFAIISAALCVGLTSSHIITVKGAGIPPSSASSTNKDRDYGISIITTQTSTVVDGHLSSSIITSTTSTSTTSAAFPTGNQGSDKRADVDKLAPFSLPTSFHVACRQPFWVLDNIIIARINDGKVPEEAVFHRLTENLTFQDWEEEIGKFKKLLEAQSPGLQKDWGAYMNKVVGEVSQAQRYCRMCGCADDGTMIPGAGNVYRDGSRASNRVNRQKCRVKSAVIFCTSLYACECIFTQANVFRGKGHGKYFNWGLAFNPEDIVAAAREIGPQGIQAGPEPPAGYVGQAIDHNFRVNVAPPNEPEYFLEGPGPQLPYNPDAQLGMVQYTNAELPPDDPNYDPFPVDMNAYAQEQARQLWQPENRLPPPGQDVEGFFPENFPPEYENYPTDDGTGGAPGDSAGYPGYDYWRNNGGNNGGGYRGGYGGGYGGGSGGGYSGGLRKRKDQLQNTKAGDDATTGGKKDAIVEVDRGRLEIVAAS
ncbi:hypothetical protein TWF506_000406 [Arthrobotrys conoides]|uniref:Uncharacterized protein n=1 Tax=Arthrobotrys conoides TaxID=74498 RepID=A0AAN8NLD4_9PEZI